MKRRALLSLCFCLFVLPALSRPLLAKDVPGPMAKALQPMLDQHIIAGAVVLVADKDKVLDLEAIGFSSTESKAAMQPDSLFWIASMTKSVTGAAMMLLVDEGKVKLDDPVEKYLPEFKGQKALAADGKGEPHAPQHAITIKEVLSHTSGLILAGDKRLKQKLSLKENVAQVAAAPLLWEPGTKFAYNNSGINTAGRVIEVVSGMAYTDFVKQRLTDPLGMKDTTFWPDAGQASRLAHTVRLTEDKTMLKDIHLDPSVTPELIERLNKDVQVPRPILNDYGLGKIGEYKSRYAEPAGGLFSTASDMGRFCQMLLRGGEWGGKRYLSEAAVQELRTGQIGKIGVNAQETYSLGYFVKLGEEEGPGIGSFGHRGARKTVMWVDPQHDLVIVLMVQNWELLGDTQKQLYGTCMKAAIAAYGKKAG